MALVLPLSRSSRLVSASTALAEVCHWRSHTALAVPLRQRHSRRERLHCTRAMASDGGDRKPNPWRFLQWHKNNEEQFRKPMGNFVYKIQRGETLWEIAERYNIRVDILMEANSILSAENIVPGQEIWVPKTYVIKKGDTLYALSRKFGIKIQALQAANGIEDPNFIVSGDVILVPEAEEAETEDVGVGR